MTSSPGSNRACACTALIMSSLCRWPSPKLKPISELQMNSASRTVRWSTSGQVLDEQREQAPALAVHGAPGERLLHGDLGDRGVVAHRGELVDLDRHGPRPTELSLRSGTRRERPHRGAQLPAVLAHRGQEGHQVGPQVAQYRERTAGRSPPPRSATARTCRSRRSPPRPGSRRTGRSWRRRRRCSIPAARPAGTSRR